ncbi:MAG: activator of HSP90 ATPase [Bacteroidetes bacterium]|nr:activator of HSP90 ATPase [Bacteroidota bacterium]
MPEKIAISAEIKASGDQVWNCYTKPEHIVNWNFASDDWHCPKAENNLTIGGEYSVFMEAKDGSFGFNLKATYTHVKLGESFIFEMADGRNVSFEILDVHGLTRVEIVFDAESQNPLELQRQGWQAILDNFKKYTESQSF